jgi:hypothetical protein
MGCRPAGVGGCSQVVGRRRVGPRNGMSALSPDGIYLAKKKNRLRVNLLLGRCSKES